MKKSVLKNERGITLIMLMLTIIIIALLLGVVASNIDIGGDIRNYNYMCADIELLESKIMTYYNENGKLPTTGGTIVDAKLILGSQASPRDDDNYYQIDINKLYNITLNYGGGTLEDKDIYIVNEQSHNVYYLKGVMYEDKVYHTISRRDETIGDGENTEEEIYMTLTVNVTERKHNNATITATGAINTDDTLNYTLTLSDGQTYGPNTTNTWNISGLTPLTTYTYTVTASTVDGEYSTTKEGSFTTEELVVEITLDVSVSNIESNSATITATGTINTDDTLNYKLTLSDGQTYGPSEENTWNLENLTAETTYTYTVTASTVDGIYSVTKSGKFTTTEEANSAPVLTAYDYKTYKTTTQFAIAMNATDVNGDTLTYTLKASTSQNGTYYTIGTATASPGTTKTITVTSINGTSLSEYAQYWWKVEVTDNNGGTDETSGNLHTYCSGGYECSGWSCSGHIVECDACRGSGKEKGHEWVWTKRTDTTNGSYSTSCPNCKVHFIYYDWYECAVSACESTRFIKYCMTCDEELQEAYYEHDTTIACLTCNGNPIEYIACPNHGYSTEHWACGDWSTDDSSAIQHYHQCSHGCDDPHD